VLFGDGRWIKEAETGGAALHHKLRSGLTSTALMAHNICWVGGMITAPQQQMNCTPPYPLVKVV